jgi:hypothetical protein
MHGAYPSLLDVEALEDLTCSLMAGLRVAACSVCPRTAGDPGPNPELLVEQLREVGVQATADLLTTVLVMSWRQTWVGGTPGGYLNIIDGRWDVWGEVDRADWISFPNAGGQVEIWFTGLPSGKLWLAIIEVQAYTGPSGGGPQQFRVGSSDTGPQFVNATFQRQYLGVLFVDQHASGLNLVALQPVNLWKFSFYRTTLLDVLG